MADYLSRAQSQVTTRPVYEWNQALDSLSVLGCSISDFDTDYMAELMAFTPPEQVFTAPPSESAHSDLSVRSLKRCDNALSQQDWEDRKELIGALYNEMTLDQMIVYMREQHGFDAKRYMYLRRITRWGFNKNVKAKEKQVVADRMANNNGMLPPDIMVPLHKVQRHIKDQQKLATPQGVNTTKCKRTVPHASTMTRSADLARLNYSYSSSTVMTGDFVFIPSAQAHEEFLVALREYTTVRLEVRLTPAPTTSRTCKVEKRVSKLVNDFWAHLRSASFALDSHGHAETWVIHLGRACDLVQVALEQSHWRFMLRLITELYKLMKLDTVVAHELLGFTQEMAQIVFGLSSKHCVVRLLEIFSSICHQPDVFESAGQIVLQTVERQMPKDVDIHYLACRDVQFLYSVCKLHKPAQRLAASAARNCLDLGGGTDLKSREALFRLSRCHLEVGNYQATRDMTQSLLQTYRDADLPPDKISISAAEDLAVSCLYLGMIDDALEHLLSAVSTLDHLRVRWKTYQPHRDYCTQLIRNIQKWRLRISVLPALDTEIAELAEESICGVADKDFQNFEMQYIMNS